MEEYCLVHLGNSRCKVLISAKDRDKVSTRNWTLSSNRYALTEEYVLGKRKQISLHRFILGLKFGDGKIVDHANGNTLDNRRENLRICTHSQNGHNRKSLLSRSGYRGVKYSPKDKNQFRAILCVSGKYLYSKRFPSSIEAAREYDKMAKRYFGEFAKLNFPE